MAGPRSGDVGVGGVGGLAAGGVADGAGGVAAGGGEGGCACAPVGGGTGLGAAGPGIPGVGEAAASGLGDCVADPLGAVDGGSVVAVTRNSDDGGLFVVVAVLHAVSDSMSSTWLSAVSLFRGRGQVTATVVEAEVAAAVREANAARRAESRGVVLAESVAQVALLQLGEGQAAREPAPAAWASTDREATRRPRHPAGRSRPC